MDELRSIREQINYDSWDGPEAIWSRTWNGKSRAKAIATAERFWSLACDYFEWCDDNPFKRLEMIKGGPGAGTRVPMPVKRPYSWAGLESHLDARGIITKLDDYKRNYKNRYTNFVDVIRRVDRVILQQKYEGVVCGDFNPTILAPELAAAAARREAQQEAQAPEVTRVEIIRSEKSTLRLERPGQIEEAEVL